MGLLTLFISAFLAATILPFYSEIVLLGLLTKGVSPWACFAVATIGNTLGSLVNWVVGRYLSHFEDRRWFPVSSSQLHKAQKWFQKYGKWSLLLAWMPVGGDALTIIGGMMRVPLPIFTLLTGLGKATRYGFLILVGLGVAERL